MVYKYRWRNCHLCGCPTYGRYSPSKDVRCTECGIKVLAANILAMHNKQGMSYSKWLESAGPRGRPRKPRKR